MITAAIWLSFAFGLGLVMRLVGLPPLVGYLAAGFILSANGYESNHLLEEVAHAGVLLLLFSVGLKLRLKSLLRAEVVGVSLLHMAITVGVFFLLLTQFTGLERNAVIMVALALSFSSTVVAAKVLESKRELRAFHGRVAIGILIVQDLVAVAALSLVGGAAPSPWAFLACYRARSCPWIKGMSLEPEAHARDILRAVDRCPHSSPGADGDGLSHNENKPS